jgi:hypothetical protein
MIWQYQKTSERIREWATFRHKIDKMPFEKALLETVKLWSYAPIINSWMDFTDSSTWPDPWELIEDSGYDELAKSLGMLYTLYLSGHTDHSYSLLIGLHQIRREYCYIVSIDDGKYVLNYEWDEIVNTQQIDPKVKVMCHYTPQDLQLDQYT